MTGAGRKLGLGLACGLTALLGACAVGPDYHPPRVPTPSSYAEIGDARSAPLSRPLPDEADLSTWWTQFNDPLLNWLVDRALAQNLNLKVSVARLRQAREAVAVARSAGLPQVGSDLTVARLNANSRSLRLPEGAAAASGAVAGAGAGAGAAGGAAGESFDTPSDLNLYSAALDATWEIDIFGGTERGVEEARASTQAAVWRKRDGEVSLTAEVATDYLTLRMLQAQIAIATGEAEAQTANLAIIRQQAQTGLLTRLNINQQDAQVEATIAAVPQLQAQARAQVHALAVLLAMTPDALDRRLSPGGPLPTVPDALPVGLPSDLLRRRPDVREAERTLAAATAGIGVQVANLYPKFNILAAGPAFASTATTGLFNANNAASVGAGMIQWPLFQGGRIRANIRSARAQADEAYYTYQQAVLTALQNVEDDLARYRSDQLRVPPLRRAVESAENSLTISRQQFQVGLVTYLNVLQAQNTVLNARNQLTQANAQLAQDLASLYRALGGGWTADEAKDQKPPGVSWP